MSKKIKMENSIDIKLMAKAEHKNNSKYVAFINDLFKNPKSDRTVSIAKIYEKLNNLFCRGEYFEGISELSLDLVLSVDFKCLSADDIFTILELLALLATKIKFFTLKLQY